MCTRAVLLSVDALATAYRVTQVPEGNHLVIAGTDMNNDGVTCDDGEACGAYPVEFNPEVVPVGTGTVVDVDFTTAYRTNIDASLLAPTRATAAAPLQPLRVAPAGL